MAFEAKIPGIKSAHRIVTPQCRINKGDNSAAYEAVQSLLDAFAKYSPDDGGNVNWHFVLVREDGPPDESEKEMDNLCSDCPPVGYPTDATRCADCPLRSRP